MAALKRPDLGRYRNKRNPAETTEPFGAEQTHPSRETWHGGFVVHLHAARQRHYDLRLECGGALLSFAVPRGPSLNPVDKRLAVQTEPHPLAYLGYEGVIAEGNYGAGAMIVWDLGRVQYLERPAQAGEEAGKFDFILEGCKLRGRFALVLTRGGGTAQKHWLLLKKPDAHARSDPAQAFLDSNCHGVLSHLTVEQRGQLSTQAESWRQQALELGATAAELDTSALTPMLCARTRVGLSDPSLLYELKLDGARAVADTGPERTVLRYRSRRPATDQFPEIAAALRTLPPVRLVLDGELLVYDALGRPSFERLQRRLAARDAVEVERASLSDPAQFVLFDLLQVGELSLRSLPLVQRKALLSRLLPGRGVTWVLEHSLGDGQALFRLCEQSGLEGVVAKRVHSLYRPGPKRTGDWVKLKPRRRGQFVVVGVVAGKGSRGRYGSLELASRSEAGWVYRGRVGSGLSAESERRLEARLQPRESPAPVEGLPKPTRETRWVEPTVAVQVEFLEWTTGGRLRMPIYCDTVDSASPLQCSSAPPAVAGAGDTPQAGQASVGQAPPPSRHSPRLRLTRRDKIFWPDEAYTKGDLIDYYEQVAEWLLPYLRDRPLVLVRYPDGIRGKSFYQWSAPRGTPSWVKTIALPRSDDQREPRSAFVVDEPDALLYIANLGAIPLHILAFRSGSMSDCDFLTVDFDLGPCELSVAVRLALSLRAIVADVGLHSYVKTSGQSGLHVLVPLGTGVPFSTAKALGELLGRVLQRRHPRESTMRRGVDQRGARVYIDTGQTGRRRTIVAPYSVRAYPGASVSVPLHWEELHLALEPQRHTLKTVPLRLARMGDPMEPLLRHAPNLSVAVERLGKLVQDM